MRRTGSIPAWVLALALALTLACSDDGGGEGTDTGDGDGDETGDGDGDGAPNLPPDFTDQLTKAGGCGDVYIGVTNEDATLALMFNGAAITAMAHELGETQVRVSELPSPDVNLRAAVGTLLDDGCNDSGDGPQIVQEWTAVSGTVTLTVVPTGMPQPWETPADATLELTNVSFEAEGYEPVVVESFIVEDVYVGWFPG